MKTEKKAKELYAKSMQGLGIASAEAEQQLIDTYGMDTYRQCEIQYGRISRDAIIRAARSIVRVAKRYPLPYTREIALDYGDSGEIDIAYSDILAQGDTAVWHDSHDQLITVSAADNTVSVTDKMLHAGPLGWDRYGIISGETGAEIPLYQYIAGMQDSYKISELDNWYV